MNYRNTAIEEFVTLAKETESFQEGGEDKSFTIGQVILAILKRTPEGADLKEWLRDISDENMYTVIEETKIKERP